MSAIQSIVHLSHMNLAKALSPEHIIGQVNQLIKAVEELSSKIPSVSALASAVAIEQEIDEESPEIIALASARRLLSVRRKREAAFGGKLFCDPAWDILIELYVAKSDQSDLSVGDACVASGVPLTSALRCCQMLERRGIVHRDRDPCDRRRIFLRLTDSAFAILTKILAVR